jgi:phosphoglycerate dehydrogenase-like enzyme
MLMEQRTHFVLALEDSLSILIELCSDWGFLWLWLGVDIFIFLLQASGFLFLSSQMLKSCHKLVRRVPTNSSFDVAIILKNNLSSKILICDGIDPICSEIFLKRGHQIVEKSAMKKDELLACIHEYDGLVVRSATKVTKDVINAGVNLKIIGRAGTGVDNIDCQYSTNKGILVVNTPGGNTVSTAELAVSHILALARNIPQATASLKEGRWDRALYTGTELSGKVLGVIGMGRIGREVAQRCQGFGMVTIGYDPLLSESASRKCDVEPVSLEDLFARSDFITIHTPLTKETKYIFDKVNLAKCKKGVKIVNCARGGIIQEDDLLEAIKSGHVAGASLDTLEVEPPVDASLELRTHPNVIMTPHLGASTIDAQVRYIDSIIPFKCLPMILYPCTTLKYLALIAWYELLRVHTPNSYEGETTFENHHLLLAILFSSSLSSLGSSCKASC